MKNSFLIVISCLLFSISSQAQKKKTIAVKQLNVPENVSNSFKSMFTTVSDDQWSKNYSGNYIVAFTNADNLKQVVEFTGSGAVVKSKVQYALDALPQNLSASITAQYPNAKVNEAAKLQVPGVAPYYKVKIMNADNTSKELLVSEDGTISE